MSVTSNQSSHIDRKVMVDAYYTKRSMNRGPKQNMISPVKYHDYKSIDSRPVYAGELCNPTQEKLANLQSFTGQYKVRFNPDQGSSLNNGDYCSRPIDAIRMLNSTSHKDLTIPTRAGDFKTEVEWRLSLRPQFN